MKYFVYVFGIITLWTSVSCSTTEEIWINKDNSIRREITMDASFFGMMAGMQDAFANQDFNDSTILYEEGIYSDSMELIVDREVAREPIEEMETDSLTPAYDFQEDENAIELEDQAATADDEGFNQIMELFQREQLDTLFDFAHLLPMLGKAEGMTKEQMEEEIDDDPSMTDEEKAAIKSLMGVKLRLRINKAEGLFKITLIQDFENAEALSASNNVLSMLSSMSPGGMPKDPATEEMMRSIMGSAPIYELRKGEFSIRRTGVDMSELMEQMGPAAGMFGNTYLDYQYIIHVPKKVKSVNQSGAEIEGNVITLDAPVKLGAAKAFELIVKYK